MSEIIHDACGRRFELRSTRNARGLGSGYPSLRQYLEHLQSTKAILEDSGNRTAMARALADAGVLMLARAETMSFEELRQRTQRALSEGVLELAPYVPNLRPIIDQSVFEVQELSELAEEPLEEADESPTFLEVQVLYEDGRPYRDCEIAVDIPGENRRKELLDDQAKVRLDDVPPGVTCIIEFPQALPMPDPKSTPLEPPLPAGEVVTISRRDPELVRLVGGKDHRIVVRRARVHLLQMDDVHFQLGRAVLLADGEPPVDDGDERDTRSGSTSLSIAAAMLQFAKEHPEQQLLVAGHTDTTGSATFNADLSEARARNVQLYLAGDGDGWAAHCADNAADEDAQRALRWAARNFGWPCDPGPVDNAFGRRSRAALKAFRARFASETGGTAGDGDTATLDDWRAVYDLYDQELGALLGGRENLASWREVLTFVEPATLACGESWPEEAVGMDDYPSAQNRRVDLLFFDEEELPPDLGDLDPPGKSIYGDPMYVLERIDVDPHERPDHRVYFELALDIGDGASEFAGASLRLAADGYELTVALEDAIDLGGGLRAFRFRGVHHGTSYTLTLEPRDGESVTLFEDLTLDAFLDGIGDLEVVVEPLLIAPIPLAEADEDSTDAADYGPMHPEVSLADLGDSGMLEGLA